eukprot:1124429_1
MPFAIQRYHFHCVWKSGLVINILITLWIIFGSVTPPILDDPDQFIMHSMSQSKTKLHACNILVAHGGDPYSGLATLVYIYGVNFLLMAERRNMTLWIDYTAEYNNIYYDSNYHANVFEYYFKGITPEAQDCNRNTSNYHANVFEYYFKGITPEAQ